MGLKHLNMIEKLLSENKEWYSITLIRDILKTDWYTVVECLDYLEKQGKITKYKGEQYTAYKWK